MTDRITDFIIESIAPYFEPLWNSLVFWRLYGLAITLIIISGITNRNKLLSFFSINEKRNRDQATFNNLFALVEDEKFNSILDNLLGNHCFFHSELRHISSIVEYIDNNEPLFHDKKINNIAIELNHNLKSLREFLYSEFDAFPYHQPNTNDLRSCLKPKWNIDRNCNDPKYVPKYNMLASQLRSLVNQTDHEWKRLKQLSK